MKFIDALFHGEGVALTYALLDERPATANISHKKMPSFLEHSAFVHSRPYRVWFVIIPDGMEEPVGAIYLTWQNELGISILREHQGKGYGRAAVKALLEELPPLTPIPSKRPDHIVAHVSVNNSESMEFFESLGAKVVQHTYQL